MLMSRVFAISRFETAWREKSKPWISLGDLALAAVIAISLMEPHDQAWRFILRHGALMPLYMLVLYDLALGRGLAARFFSLPGMSFLGQLSFSIFIWQNLFMALGFAMVMAAPQIPGHLVLVRRHRAPRDVRDQHALHREAAGAQAAPALCDLDQQEVDAGRPRSEPNTACRDSRVITAPAAGLRQCAATDDGETRSAIHGAS